MSPCVVVGCLFPVSLPWSCSGHKSSVSCYDGQLLWYSDALRYSPFSSKYSTKRFRNLSLLTVSASHTTQHCRLARVTATFIRLWSLKNPTWGSKLIYVSDLPTRQELKHPSCPRIWIFNHNWEQTGCSLYFIRHLLVWNFRLLFFGSTMQCKINTNVSCPCTSDTETEDNS